MMMLPERLLRALPTMIRPPQSPGDRLPALRCDVKTTGAASVPLATMRAPRRMNSAEPSAVVSPTSFVPALMVSVAPLFTYTKPRMT